MKKLIKLTIGMITLLLLLAMLAIGGCYGYLRIRMVKEGVDYTTAVENTILDFVPEQGVTVQGRNYDYWSMKNFLEEIRYDPYNYVHKDHHCVLQYVPEQRIFWIVSGLRIIMGCH